MEVFPVEVGPQRINHLRNFIPLYIVHIQAGIYINHLSYK